MKAIYNYTKLLSEEKKRSNILATENALKKKKIPQETLTLQTEYP